VTDYTTIDVVKRRLAINDSAWDIDLALLITVASRAIDRWCKRPDNGFVGTTETRTFDIPASLQGPQQFTRDMTLAGDLAAGQVWTSDVVVVPVDPLLSVTTLKTDPTGDLSYGDTWTQGTDYDLLPINAALDGRPYRQVRALPNGTKAFPIGVRALQIAGVWGESVAVPPPIAEATFLVASRAFSRRKQPYGLTEDIGAGTSRIPSVDPDVDRYLCEAGYVNRWVMV
jgi:hypothetical protein